MFELSKFVSKVEEITLDFARRIQNNGVIPPVSCPETLGRMGVAASLGSGVRYEIAERIANSLPIQPLPKHIDMAAATHRFPNQAHSRMTALFSNESLLLKDAIAQLSTVKNVREERKHLANAIPGIGPKQSSFLFCLAGYGQEIAVLDRHILRYSKILGLAADIAPPTSWKKYEDIEFQFLKYAERNSITADALDVAIWITMKAAGKKVTSCAL